MEVEILQEAGYDIAIRAVGLSFGVVDEDRLRNVAFRLADRDGGHNKFLESMQVWINIKAARYFWQEFDTYRVGTTKQSESTIHTICRTKLSQEDFEHPIYNLTLDYINKLIDNYNNTEIDLTEKNEIFKSIKANLPEGYLQRRIVCTNYKVLRNIIWQRRNHRLNEWHQFIDTLKTDLEYSDLLFKGWDK